MTANTKIEWADHTFNPWIGCTRVSLTCSGGGGCDNCYAAVNTAARALKVKWGAGEPRHRTSVDNWQEPLRWEAKAERFLEANGRRQRVFCASLADVFDNEVDAQWRADLLTLIHHTPSLDWLLLTKRIGNAAAMLDVATSGRWKEAPLPNVWLGATVVNQKEADRDIPKLLAAPAGTRFLSIEPMLGPVDLRGMFDMQRSCFYSALERGSLVPQRVDWVIAGGESGPHARPVHPDWLRSLQAQCFDAGVPFLFKQWGEWAPPEAIPQELWSPIHDYVDDAYVMRAGKKATGRTLDGVEHNGFPEVVAC